MAVLAITSGASATSVTTDALAGGADPIDTLLNDPSQQIAWPLLEQQLRGHEGLHQSHSSKKHHGGNTGGEGGQGGCAASSVPISTTTNGHSGHQGKKKSRPPPPPPSTTSCPPPNPAGGGSGTVSNDPPGGNGDPTGSSGSDSNGVWLSDAIGPNAPAPEPGSLALLGLGLAALWLGKRRR